MANQAGRFVDHQQVVILVNDLQQLHSDTIMAEERAQNKRELANVGARERRSVFVAGTLPRSHAPPPPPPPAPPLPRSHAPTLPRSHAPTLPRSHAPTLPRSHAPTLGTRAGAKKSA